MTGGLFRHSLLRMETFVKGKQCCVACNIQTEHIGAARIVTFQKGQIRLHMSQNIMWLSA